MWQFSIRIKVSRFRRQAAFNVGFNTHGIYTHENWYNSTHTHTNTDAQSGLSAMLDLGFEDNLSSQMDVIQGELSKQWSVKVIEMKRATNHDKLLRGLVEFVRTQWSSDILLERNRELLPYVNGCLLRDQQQVIIPLLHRTVLVSLGYFCLVFAVHSVSPFLFIGLCSVCGALMRL
jgi:hypothetical protein